MYATSFFLTKKCKKKINGTISIIGRLEKIVQFNAFGILKRSKKKFFIILVKGNISFTYSVRCITSSLKGRRIKLKLEMTMEMQKIKNIFTYLKISIFF